MMVGQMGAMATLAVAMNVVFSAALSWLLRLTVWYAIAV
jgi:hypothetical protein